MYTSDDIYKQLANNQYINIDYWPHIFGLLSRENKKGIHFEPPLSSRQVK